MFRPEADQAGKNWFRGQNITLQKKEGKDTQWEVSSEVRKMGCKTDTKIGQRYKTLISLMDEGCSK